MEGTDGLPLKSTPCAGRVLGPGDTACVHHSSMEGAPRRIAMVSRSEDGSAESADGAEAEAEATGNGVRTCLGCRRAKVKCDMATPCSRCTRLSVECVPTPPSRRGRAGERKVKRKRQAIGVQTEDFQGISKMAKYELMIVDTCADGLEPAKEGESEPHLALTALCTMWLMMGIRERSNELMMQAFSCATRCGIAMDAILDAQGTPHAVDGSLAGLAALLFTPGHLQPIEIDTPLGVSQIPPEICATVGRTQDTINEGWVLVRTHSRGRMRIFASQAFERDIVTWDTLMTNLRKGDRPCIELVLPQVECGKCMHTLGELHRQYPSVRSPPPTARFQTQVNQRDGTVCAVDALMAMRIAACGTLYYVHTFTARPPIASVELTAHAALSGAGAGAVHRAPPGLPLEPTVPPPFDVGPEIVDWPGWEPYLGADVDTDMAFLLGLGI
eukprot:m.116971 g.116971  ORF g.116971 m.116971 type:complete len:443 (-) comp21665_c0_seq2:182-1510(-)